ncbi:cyclopropane fatty acyl phospholipid synthase [candidate division KSB1 bacterium]|nr:cyclopropane fatty acyl phospholipid synthase [candidate division KSB1 bacterium]
MAQKNAEAIVKELLSFAGISINGEKPYDIQVHNSDYYQRLLRDGSLGSGESYMEGWWDCLALDQFFARVIKAEVDRKFRGNWKLFLPVLKSRFFNLQKKRRAFQVGEKHYDIGNDLYREMLDKRLNYTCGYWKGQDNLDKAQEAKLELVCTKLNLQPGMHVLELGCGFGAFAGYAAEKYGVHVTGVTVSHKQVELAKELYADLPVEINLQDYRTVKGKFDRVISIGIMEHIGYKNYTTYMKVVARTLKEDGIAFIHTIGGNRSRTSVEAWTDRYIFPNGMVPSIAQLGTAMEGRFIMEDWHNFGPDYDRTLMAWHHNFEKAWPKLATKYGDRFYRMWRYYLLSCAGCFRARGMQLWQIVMSKPGQNQPDCRIT